MNQSSLDTVINTIHQKWGYRALQTANQLSKTQNTLTTGFDVLDKLIGGIPQQNITQITNRPTAGGMTVILRLMANAQQNGQHVVLVDRGTSFDGGYASNCGVDVDSLVLVETKHEALSLDVLVEVVRSRIVELVVLNFMTVKSIHLDWRKILPMLWGSPTAVVILTRPQIVLPIASLRLNLIHQQWIKQFGDIIGCVSQVTIERNRYGAIQESVQLSIPFGKGYKYDLYPDP